MLLLDTSVWLEVLLEQEKADQVRRLIEARESSQFALTDFSLHSLGVILARLNKDDLFVDFLSDTVEDSAVRLIQLGTEALKSVVAARRRFGLDFDDAYQYVAAEEHDMTLVSFDAAFDHTQRGRKTPAQLLEPKG